MQCNLQSTGAKEGEENSDAPPPALEQQLLSPSLHSTESLNTNLSNLKHESTDSKQVDHDLPIECQSSLNYIDGAVKLNLLRPPFQI